MFFCELFRISQTTSILNVSFSKNNKKEKLLAAWIRNFSSFLPLAFIWRSKILLRHEHRAWAVRVKNGISNTRWRRTVWMEIGVSHTHCARAIRMKSGISHAHRRASIRIKRGVPHLCGGRTVGVIGRVTHALRCFAVWHVGTATWC